MPASTITRMSDYTEDEVTRLHVKLAAIYRLGVLTRQEKTEVNGLWARIERLETARVMQITKEAGYQEIMKGKR